MYLQCQWTVSDPQYATIQYFIEIRKHFGRNSADLVACLGKKIVPGARIRPILDQIDCDQCSFFLFLSYFVVRRVSPILFYQLSAIEEPEGGQNVCLAVLLMLPFVFCAIFALLPFFLFLRCQRPCAAPLPVVYTILDISETSFFVTPIGFLSTRNRWIRLPRLHLKLLSRPEGGRGYRYDSLYGEAPPERGIFFRLQVYERVGNSLFEVYKKVGKSVV